MNEIACSTGTYRKFTGIILWGDTEGAVKKASFELSHDDNKQFAVDFYRGVWLYGTWGWGNFLGGIWRNGIWKDGVWHRGVWCNGVWRDGRWKGGTCKKRLYEPVK